MNFSKFYKNQNFYIQNLQMTLEQFKNLLVNQQLFKIQKNPHMTLEYKIYGNFIRSKVTLNYSKESSQE